MRISDYLLDFKRGARSLLRSPGFAAAAIVTLALGIGATSAIFSIVDAVLLEPLPYAEPERRVMIWSRWKGFDKTWLSEAEVLDYRREVPSLVQVAAWSSGQANLTGDGEPVRLGIAAVTANTFSTLGGVPLIGRVFSPEEDRKGGDSVVILSHGLWSRRYGGDPGMVGRTILMNGSPRLVVGVMPQGFRLPTDFTEDAAEPSQAWIPLAIDNKEPTRGSHGLYGAAELKPGATVEQASAELATLTANLTKEGLYPEPMQFSAFAVGVGEEILGGARPAVLLLFGAVGFLLLIACANVANLLLARAEGRQREMAVRSAIGAGPGRILRQLLIEGFALAAPSLALGLGLAHFGLRFLASFGIAGVPRAGAAELDGRAVLFTTLVALGTSLLFSLAPALRTWRVNYGEALRAGPGTSAGATRQRLRGALVVAEMALSVILLIGAGLMFRSLVALRAIDVGFEPKGVLTLRLSLPRTSYPEPEQVHAFGRQLLERVRALPETRAAGLIRSLPLGAQIGDWGVDVAGYVEEHGHHAQGDWQVASDGALEALGMRLVRGRLLGAHDTADAEQVALVNETMARTYWPDGDAIDGRIRMGSDEDGPWVRVVGVVGDVRHNGVRAPVKTKFYRPSEQFHRSTGFPIRAMSLVVKTDGDPLALVPAVRAAVRSLDANLPIAAVRPMTDVVAASIQTHRLAGLLLGVFASVALVLSAVGIYGVLSYLVSRRRIEIGVRIAIGAQPGDVVRLILMRGLGLALLGVMVGSASGVLLARLMASLLYQVQSFDAVTYAAVPTVLMAVALAASYLPARRATRIDPIEALRAE